MRNQTAIVGGMACSFLLGLSACATLIHNAPPALPPYIHTLAVHPLSNHTQQYGLEDKLTLAVQSEFNRDGRYQVSTENAADGIVSGDITRYTLEPLSYNSNHVPTEYRLSILVSVSFYDKVQKATLWQEPDMRGELRYFVSSSGFAGALTEDDARQTIFDELARDIRTRTLENTGRKKDSGVETSTDTVHPKLMDDTPPAEPSQEPTAPSPTRIPY